jgi:hypothetical protein
LLVKTRIAEVVLYKSDGTRAINYWNANKLTTNSNLRGNIWSGLLRNWKAKGVVSANFTVNPSHKNNPEFERDQILASELGLTFSEINEIDEDYELTKYIDNDGRVYDYEIRFFDNVDPKILVHINGLNEDKTLKFGAFTNMWDAITPFCTKSVVIQ